MLKGRADLGRTSGKIAAVVTVSWHLSAMAAGPSEVADHVE